MYRARKFIAEFSYENYPDAEYKPLFLNESDSREAEILSALRSREDLIFKDLHPMLIQEWDQLVDQPPGITDSDTGYWVYYPWRRSVLGIPNEEIFRAVRLDRNRNKLTRAEQGRLASLSIGVVGQSVGHAVAYAIAMEGICGSLRLADADTLALSNLNRVPASLFDIGVNKAVITARRIAEIDPYLTVDIHQEGVRRDSVDEFLSGIDILVDECDSLDVKLLLREAARRNKIPVVMETSDRGLLDVERYDLEPDRPLLHGFLGEIKSDDLSGLTTKEKAPYVISILEHQELSPLTGASFIEVDSTLNSWPQLGGEVAMAGASVAAVIRRFGLGKKLESGRVRVDLEARLDELDPAVTERAIKEPTWEEYIDPEIMDEFGSDVELAIRESARRAPSGGNAQPWIFDISSDQIRIVLDARAPSAIDVSFRGSAIAVGAALYNARSAAAAFGRGGTYAFCDHPDKETPLSVTLRYAGTAVLAPAADYRAALQRETNRNLGDGRMIPDEVLTDLVASAAAEGAVLRYVVDPAALVTGAKILAEADRIRYLTPRLHREMIAETRWPEDDLTTGIDVRTLALDAGEQGALALVGRTDIMARLREWSAGSALGDYTRKRVESSSALVVVTLPNDGITPPLSDFARAGCAVERMWIQAQRRGLAVHPVSPVFLFAQDNREMYEISPHYADRLISLRRRFVELLGVPDYETMALVLRLSYADAPGVRSRRRLAKDADDRG